MTLPNHVPELIDQLTTKVPPNAFQTLGGTLVACDSAMKPGQEFWCDSPELATFVSWCDMLEAISMERRHPLHPCPFLSQT